MKRIRKYLVLLLVLAYAGQALAAAGLPCAAMASAAKDMPSAAHAGHHMDGDSGAAAMPSSQDCCEGGLCAMSACQAAAALPPGQFHSGPQYLAVYPRSPQATLDSQPSESLYRPPISH
ncbi:MAG: hypothetical protein H6985_11810 [Pseudomonadales bacterium]|nr:hypothetical protein [Pseudomonadales bacterium]